MYKLRRRLTAFILALTVLSVNTISAFADIDKSTLSKKYYDETNEEWSDNGYLNPSYFDSFGNAYDESAIPQFTYDEDGNITGANDAYYNDWLPDPLENLTDEERAAYEESFVDYPITLNDINLDEIEALSNESDGDEDTYFAAAAATAAGIGLLCLLFAGATGYVLSKDNCVKVMTNYENNLRVSGKDRLLSALTLLLTAKSVKSITGSDDLDDPAVTAQAGSYTLSGFNDLTQDLRAWYAANKFAAGSGAETIDKTKVSLSSTASGVSYSSPFSPAYKCSDDEKFLFSFSFLDSNIGRFTVYDFYQIKIGNFSFDQVSPYVNYFYSSTGTALSLRCKFQSSSFGSAEGSGFFVSSTYYPGKYSSTGIYTEGYWSFGSSKSSKNIAYLDNNDFNALLSALCSSFKSRNIPLFDNVTNASNYALYGTISGALNAENNISYPAEAYQSFGTDYDMANDYYFAKDEDIDTLLDLIKTSKSSAESISYINQYLHMKSTESATSTTKQLIANWEYIIDCFAAAGGVTDYDYATVTAAAGEELAKILDMPEGTFANPYDTKIVQFSDYTKSTGPDKDPKKKTHYLKKAIASALAFALGYSLVDISLPDNINVISDSFELPDPDPAPAPDPDVDLNATNNILMNILTQIKALPNAISNALTDMLIGIKEAIINLPDLIQGVLAGDPMAVQQYLAQINASIDAATDAVKNIDPSGGSSGDGGGIEESGNDSDSQNILKGFVYIPFLLFVLLIIFINCMRLIVSIFNIQASTAVFNSDFLQGFDYIKSVQLPLFNITLYQLLIGGCYFCLLCSVIRVLRKRIDSIHS